MENLVSMVNATDVVCNKCKNKYFIEVYIVKKLSKLLTGNTDDSYIPINILKCERCGEILNEIYPKELQEKEDSTIIKSKIKK